MILPQLIQSEHAIRRLEEKVENLESKLEKESKDKQAQIEIIESLKEKLEDAEQEVKNSHKSISDLNEKTLYYEFKQAELTFLDVAVLKAKVTDLEGTITGKDRLISLLKDQAQLSLKEITKLRQIPGKSEPVVSDTTNMSQSDAPSHPDSSLHIHSPQPCTPLDTPISSSLQSDTSTSDAQPTKILWSHMKVTTLDQNYNEPIIKSSENCLITRSNALESSPHSLSLILNTTESPLQDSPSGPDSRRKIQ